MLIGHADWQSEGSDSDSEDNVVITIFSDNDNFTTTNFNLPKNQEEKVEESRALHITNLVRPFSLDQLTALLFQTGTYDIENRFWINSVRSHCFVIYHTIEVARQTYQALHNRQWPRNSEKRLNVEYVVEDSKKMQLILQTLKSNQQQILEESAVLSLKNDTNCKNQRQQSLSFENQRLEKMISLDESNDSQISKRSLKRSSPQSPSKYCELVDFCWTKKLKH